MRRLLVFTIAIAAGLMLTGQAGAAGSSSIAALQVALQAHGFYPAAVDGVQGPLTTTGLTNLQRTRGIPVTGPLESKTRSALGPLGRPLLGQRELAVGAVGWDVSSLEFRLIPYGLDPKAVDGRFTAATAGALARFQAKKRLTADGIAGKLTFRALAGRTVSRARSRRRRWRRTSSPPARASTRSRSATASARCCSRSRTGSSCPP